MDNNKQMTRWPAGVSYRNASRTLRSTIEVTIKSNKEKINGAAGAFTIPTGTPWRCKPNNLTDPSSLTGPIEQQERVLFCYHQIPHVLVARSNRSCVKVCLCKKFKWGGCTSSYFLSASSAISFAWDSWLSKMATLSSSMLVLFSKALRILHVICTVLISSSSARSGGHENSVVKRSDELFRSLWGWRWCHHPRTHTELSQQ